MIKKNIIDYIVKSLSKKKTFFTIYKKQDNSFNYVDSKILDSLELLKFHMSLEKKFKLKFSTSEITSEKIKTIEGLAVIIFKKLN
tara:strand:- start:91 stop:345 length:255 start_codon:yes stop_codon:yes gene_type:complete